METPQFLPVRAWRVPASPADGQPGLSGARSLTQSVSQSVTEEQPGAAASSGMHQAFKWASCCCWRVDVTGGIDALLLCVKDWTGAWEQCCWSSPGWGRRSGGGGGGRRGVPALHCQHQRWISGPATSSDLNGTIFCTISCWIRAAEKQSCHRPACTLVHQPAGMTQHLFSLVCLAFLHALHASISAQTRCSALRAEGIFTARLWRRNSSLRPPAASAAHIHPFKHENKPAPNWREELID